MALSTFPVVAGEKLKVAGITWFLFNKMGKTTPALDAAAKRGEIEYVHSESTANTDYVRVMREYCDSGMQFIVGEAE